MSSVAGVGGVIEEGKQRTADELGKKRRGLIEGCVDIRLEEISEAWRVLERGRQTAY